MEIGKCEFFKIQGKKFNFDLYVRTLTFILFRTELKYHYISLS